LTVPDAAFTLPVLANQGEEPMSQPIKRHEPGAILSRAVEYNGMVFVAGTTADDYNLDIKGQTEQVVKKIDRLLAAAGSDKTRLLSTVIWLRDIKDKEGMNSVWQAWVGKEVPARACVQAELGSPKTLVEIMVTAAAK
jgi:enamine deaminase RidA (YjgF/YER057c/UK114 family)